MADRRQRIANFVRHVGRETSQRGKLHLLCLGLDPLHVLNVYERMAADLRRRQIAYPQRVPARLAETWIAQDTRLGHDWHRPIDQTADKALAALAEQLARWELVPTGTEGYAKAEVTAGGVDTRDLSSQTMESTHSGLYFIGEVVDVTGWLGGYNFQWAWASAYACARALAARLP